jgi:hypothetical protein
MATLNFPDDPTTGDIYTDSNSGFTYEWNGTVWISQDPSTAANIREIDNISSDFDGSDTTFTLKVAGVNVEPANVQQLIISVGGVMQNAGDDYTVSGSTLTFTTAPTSGLTFFGTLLGTALSLNTVADASVGSAALKTEDFTIGGSGNTVTIPGNLTVQGTETIINTERLDIQDKTVGIASTNAPTSASQDDAGIIIYGQTHINALYDVDKAALGISTAVNVSGFVTAAGLSVLSDSDKIFLGADKEMQVFHNGTDSLIKDTRNDGSVKVQSDNFTVIDKDASETMLSATVDGAVTLRYNGTTRFETASDDEGGGVIVTGKIVGTAATIGTGVTVNNTGIDAGNAGIVTAGTFTAPSDTTIKAGDDVILQPTDALYLKSNGDNTRLLINSVASFTFDNGAFIEKCYITAGKLSDNTNIDLVNGMVFYFTTAESTTCTPNIRENASRAIGDALSTGDVITVTIITTAAAAGYHTGLTIDSVAVTEEWVGGEAPSEGGSDGLDIYTYTCIKKASGTGDTGWTVIGNLTNASN